MLLFLAACLCSCSMIEDAYNEPIKDFFETYTETAVIELYEIPSDSVYAMDASGLMNIPSDDDFKFRFIMRNPKLFDFNRGVNLSLSLDSLDYGGAASMWGVTPDPSLFELKQDSDKSIYNVTIRKEFLESTECGFEITPTVTMTHPLTGEIFSPYKGMTLISNSSPSPASGYVFYTDPATNTYVLLFNLPSRKMMLGKQRDVTTLTIDDRLYGVSIAPDGTISLSGDGACQTGVPSSLASMIPSGTKVFTPNGQPCTFYTGRTVSNENSKFTLSLSDRRGLVSSVDAFVRAEQLMEPAAFDADGESIAPSAGLIPLVQDEDQDYASFKLVPPASTKEGTSVSGAEVFYEIYQGSDDSGSLLFSGKTSRERVFKLPLGFVFVRFYSHKNPYADSDVQEWKIKVAATILYVSNAGSDGSGNGTRSNPFATISKAIASFEDRTNTNFVRLMTDVSENVSLNDSAANYTIMGYKERKVLTGNVALASGNLGFTDVAVLGSASVTGGTFRLAGSTKISGNTSIANGSVPIYVASDFGVGSEKVLTVSPAVISDSANPIIVAENGSLNTALSLNVDVVDDTGGTDPSQVGFYLSISGGRGYSKLRSNGAGVMNPSYFGAYYVYVNDVRLDSLNSTFVNVARGGLLSFTYANDPGYSTTTFTAEKMELYDYRSGSLCASASGSELRVPANLAPGLYEVVISGSGNRLGNMKWKCSCIVAVGY
ncbi:MAG: hypothetical protein MJZ50_08190 [Treponema sp.]|nr:hypothetical protein [Treponema sp.]